MTPSKCKCGDKAVLHLGQKFLHKRTTEFIYQWRCGRCNAQSPWRYESNTKAAAAWEEMQHEEN